MRYVLVALCLPASAFGSAISISSNFGIDAIGLQGPNFESLTGAGVKIGQVEVQRPADPDVDDDLKNNSINPTQVWEQQMMPVPDGENASHHATRVAGVMISDDLLARGVATGAMLYSDSYLADSNNNEALYSIQHVWNAAGGGVRAINNSWAQPADCACGGSQLSMGVDWLATRYDILMVNSMNNTDHPDFDAPGDSYNGITVGSSERVNGAGKYRQASAFNDYDIVFSGTHYEVDLLAPGIDIQLTGLSGNLAVASGASYAAPHVTGTVALLQQYAEIKILEGGSWGDSARRHEVMKAVLLNSADKISGAQGSTRTVLNLAERDWTESTAYADPEVSLDGQMGAGHLNARRALTQFKAGPKDGPEIDNIGWHYGQTGGLGTQHVFPFAETLTAGWVSITLAWDRIVEKFGPSDPTYHQGDLFVDGGINDLDVYLLPVG